MADDDDPLFDPRLRWAVENGEDLSLISIEKGKFDKALEVLSFMQEGPKTAIDVSKRFDYTLSKVHKCLRTIRSYGVILSITFDKGTGLKVYTVKSRPSNIRFRYPQWKNKYG